MKCIGSGKKAQSSLTKPIQSKRTTRKHTSTKQSLTYSQRVEVLEWYHANGESQSKMFWHFSTLNPKMAISQPNIIWWVKNEASFHEAASTFSGRTKQKVELKYPKIEELLFTWICECEKGGQFVTGDQIEEKWQDFSRLEKIKSSEWLNLSSGWLDSFKARYNLREVKRHGEAASASPEAVTLERQWIRDITFNFIASDFYNMDQTGLFHAQAKPFFDSRFLCRFILFLCSFFQL